MYFGVQNISNCFRSPLNNHTEPILGSPFSISLMDAVTQFSYIADLERIHGSEDNTVACLTSSVSCSVHGKFSH